MKTFIAIETARKPVELVKTPKITHDVISLTFPTFHSRDNYDIIAVYVLQLTLMRSHFKTRLISSLLYYFRHTLRLNQPVLIN